MPELESPSFSIKEHLVGLARKKLPLSLGEMYADVVVTCLTCLDEDNEDFAGGQDESLLDEDGIVVGTRFIERVLFCVGEISL